MMANSYPDYAGEVDVVSDAEVSSQIIAVLKLSYKVVLI